MNKIFIVRESVSNVLGTLHALRISFRIVEPYQERDDK